MMGVGALGQLALGELPTVVKNAPVLLPLFIPRSDIDPVWQGAPLTSAILRGFTNQKFFGAPGQVPTKRWSYDHDVGESFWQGGNPQSSSILVPIETSAGQVKWEREWLFGYDDFAYWSDPLLTPQPSRLLTPALGQVTFQREWLFGYDDPAYWPGALLGSQPSRTLITSIQFPPEIDWTPSPPDESSFWQPQANPRSSSLLAPILTAGGQVQNKQWLFGYDDPSVKFPTPTAANLQILFNFGKAPFKPTWGQITTYDDPPFWVGTSSQPSRLLAPVLNSQAKWEREWLFGYDDSAHWTGSLLEPQPSRLLAPILVGQVKWEREWLFGYDDPAYQGGQSVSSHLLVPILVSAGQVKWEREWLFGYDDPAYWQGNPISNTLVNATTETTVEPFIYIPWKFGYDDPGFWVGKSFRSNVLAYFPLFVGRLISSPNNLLPGIGATRSVVTTPVVVPRVPSMPYGNNLSPIDPVVEKVTVTFNFAPWLGSGVSILSVVSISVSNAAESLANDPAPQNIIFGGSQFGALPGQPANTAVLQQVNGCQPNVTYLLQCLVVTSDSQVLNLATHLPCMPLN